MKSSRRSFLQVSGLALGSLGLSKHARAQLHDEHVSIVVDPDDPIAATPPCRWALHELSQAIQQRSIKADQVASLEQASPKSLCVVVSSTEGQLAAELLRRSQVTAPNDLESLVLLPFVKEKWHGIVASGDARGLMYAVLELTDRVQHSERPLAALAQPETTVERPFNSIRSIGRIFCSDIQDKPWYYDREMWPAYFSMLATQRINRFSLNFGVGYDFLDNVRDAYFLFAYPFLLTVPGYSVRAVALPDEERDRNLEMLQFISSQAVAHGIDFQLGIWTHGYHWGPASQPNYTTEGITPDNHAAYSRDALTALLKTCPNISGVTLRTHGESGVREGSYLFWTTVFSAIPACGRKVTLDLHTKGLDQKLVDAAIQTGVPLTLSPKYWAEHMGLPYHQAAIRELEMPREDHRGQDFFSLSSGSRSFTRYGYADFLREDRPYKVAFRIWPGSHRLLLWGDPSSAAAHSRAFAFCGSNGVELFEPLTFKGRRGSGIAGNRCAYADTALEPHWDWEKYLYTYRVWGRLLYNPDAKPEVWQRYLQKQFRPAAPAIEAAIASATPIANIVTTAHLPSAANETFNPEYYANQPIVDASEPSPYSDTPAPKVFANVSPLDPQLFTTVNEFVEELVKRERSAKYSPLEVAQWLDTAADSAASHLSQAEALFPDKNSPEFRRATIDLKLHIGIGRFFAAKFRSSVLYAAYEKAGDRNALKESLKQYRQARDVWQSMAKTAKGTYLPDITFGTSPHQRGNWLDRLPAIDQDIAEMQKRLETSAAAEESPKAPLIQGLLVPKKGEALDLQHTPPTNFTPGKQLEIAIVAPQSAPPSLAIHLYYRHVNQAERYQPEEMHGKGTTFSSVVPADYTNSKYPLQYYFELRSAADHAWLFPGLGPQLQTQPYFIVHPSL